MLKEFDEALTNLGCRQNAHLFVRLGITNSLFVAALWVERVVSIGKQVIYLVRNLFIFLSLLILLILVRLANFKMELFKLLEYVRIIGLSLFVRLSVSIDSVVIYNNLIQIVLWRVTSHM